MQKISPVSRLWPFVESWSFFDRSVWCSCLLKQRTQAYPEKLLGYIWHCCPQLNPSLQSTEAGTGLTVMHIPQKWFLFFSLLCCQGALVSIWDTRNLSFYWNFARGNSTASTAVSFGIFFFFLINLMIHVLSQKRLAGSLCNVRLSCVMVRYRFLQWAFPCLLPPCSFMGLPLCQPVSFLSFPPASCSRF